jgi:methionyl-tRNA formyltransferase
MRVLLLGNGTGACEAVRAFLVAAGEDVRLWTRQVSGDLFREFLLSYTFRWILPEEVFTFPRLGTVNAHISYLPWNRGANPNFWSHAEGTPKGTSLHRIDRGIDTGTLISREPVRFDEDDIHDTIHGDRRRNDR